MKVSGFTFVRNAIKFDYPIVEAITSILPVCDEVIVAVGNSEDDTLGLIKAIDSDKIKIIETVWDDSLRENGAVLAVETDKAFAAISEDSDWAFYLQGDEVIHEKYLPTIKDAMRTNLNNQKVEGLLFDYEHFYGSYDYIGNSRMWYRKEIRIIRNDKSIASYKDAQGFRKNDNKINVKAIAAKVHHYGWVKPPKAQQAKQKSFHKMWHNDEWVDDYITKSDEFDYSIIDSLKEFEGSHPKVMEERIAKLNWGFKYDKSKIKISTKNKVSMAIEQLTGWKIGEYKNYTILK